MLILIIISTFLLLDHPMTPLHLDHITGNTTLDVAELLQEPTIQIVKERYFIVVMIPSLPYNGAKRQAIRDTWGNLAAWPILNDVEDKYKEIKIMFVVGTLNGMEPPLELQQETSDYGDIYLAKGLQEGRLVLKYKVLWGFKQALALFDFDFFIKTDDDIFVNLPVVLQGLISYNYPTTPRIYTGSCMHVYGGFGGHPRWKYCSGGGYVLSRDILLEMAQLPESVHRVPFRPEDAYTGYLVRCLRDLRGFEVQIRSYGLLRVGQYKCGDMNKQWFYHHAKPEMMSWYISIINNNRFPECTGRKSEW